MSEFEKYIAGENSVWGKRRNNQGGRQLQPTEIAEMLNELERVKQERDDAQQSRARLVKLLCAIDETLPTDGGPHYHGLMGRLNLLTSRLEYAEQGLLDYAILRVGLTERISKAEAERDAANKRADELQKAFDALHKMHEGAFSDVRELARFIDYHCVEDLPDALTREIVKKYIDPAQPALPLAFSECPECGMTHASGENTLCSQ